MVDLVEQFHTKELSGSLKSAVMKTQPILLPHMAAAADKLNPALAQLKISNKWGLNSALLDS